MNMLISPSTLEGTISIPGSKSMAHRALICAGLADGTSKISNLPTSQDILATIGCLKALGATIEMNRNCAVVGGTRPQDLSKPVHLDARESGSTLRFLIPIAASGPEEVTFTGKSSLLSRPMGIYADLFVDLDLPFSQSGEAITFHGPIPGGLFTIPGDVSSQFISGLLLASVLMEEPVEIAVLPPYQSRSYTGLTVQMMQTFGVHVDMPTTNGYKVADGQSYVPCDYVVEGDWSQMAFFGVYGAIKSTITCTSLEKDSLQGDKVILSLLEKAGASVDWNGSDTVTVCPNGLKPQTIDLADCPDLFPALAVLAACTPGETIFTHTARLRLKESDRIAAMENALKKWGVEISSTDDEVRVQGKSSYEQPEMVEIDCCNDHRIAMAMAIFGLCAGSESTLIGAECVAKSYPDFFEALASLKAKVKSV